VRFIDVIWVRYADEKGTLVVTVVGADGLPPKDGTLLTADPYVKLTLLPEKTQRVKTRVLRHTRSPSFNEDFTFYNLTQQQVEVRMDSSSLTALV